MTGIIRLLAITNHYSHLGISTYLLGIAWSLLVPVLGIHALGIHALGIPKVAWRSYICSILTFVNTCIFSVMTSR